jgi:tripartite-type tricarboxylate transporter receptor subunit TctC
VKSGTSKEIVERLYADISKISKTPEMLKKMADVGFEHSGTTPSETASIIRRESAEWGKLIRSRGFKVD